MGKILRKVWKKSGNFYTPTKIYALSKYEKAIELLNDSHELIIHSNIDFNLKKDMDLKVKIMRQYFSLGKDLSNMKKRIRLD